MIRNLLRFFLFTTVIIASPLRASYTFQTERIPFQTTNNCCITFLAKGTDIEFYLYQDSTARYSHYLSYHHNAPTATHFNGGRHKSYRITDSPAEYASVYAWRSQHNPGRYTAPPLKDDGKYHQYWMIADRHAHEGTMRPRIRFGYGSKPGEQEIYYAIENWAHTTNYQLSHFGIFSNRPGTDVKNIMLVPLDGAYKANFVQHNATTLSFITHNHGTFLQFQNAPDTGDASRFSYKLCIGGDDGRKIFVESSIDGVTTQRDVRVISQDGQPFIPDFEQEYEYWCIVDTVPNKSSQLRFRIGTGPEPGKHNDFGRNPQEKPSHLYEFIETDPRLSADRIKLSSCVLTSERRLPMKTFRGIHAAPVRTARTDLFKVNKSVGYFQAKGTDIYVNFQANDKKTHDDYTYRLVIGGWKNKRTALQWKDAQGGIHEVSGHADPNHVVPDPQKTYRYWFILQTDDKGHRKVSIGTGSEAGKHDGFGTISQPKANTPYVVHIDREASRNEHNLKLVSFYLSSSKTAAPIHFTNIETADVDRVATHDTTPPAADAASAADAAVGSAQGMTAMINKNFPSDRQDQMLKKGWLSAAQQMPVEPVFAWWGRDYTPQQSSRQYNGTVYRADSAGNKSGSQSTQEAVIVTDRIRQSFYDGQKILIPYGEISNGYLGGDPAHGMRKNCGIFYRDTLTGDMYFHRASEGTAVVLPAQNELATYDRLSVPWVANHQFAEPMRGLVCMDVTFNPGVRKGFRFRTISSRGGHKTDHDSLGHAQWGTFDSDFWSVAIGLGINNGGSYLNYKHPDITTPHGDISSASGASAIPFPSPTPEKLWVSWDYSNALKSLMSDRAKRTSDYDEAFRIGFGEPDLAHDPHPDNRIFSWTPNKALPHADTLWYRWAISAAEVGATFSNIQSKHLSPHRFCTPPFMYHRFLYWRDDFKAKERNKVSWKFKAYGDSVCVALSGKKESTRGLSIPGADPGTFTGLDFNYAVIAGSVTNVYRKGSAATYQGEKNTYAYGSQGAVWSTKVASARKGISSSSSYKPWWISYDKQSGNLRFGSGEEIGENVIIDYTDADPLDVEWICFSCDKYPIDYIDITSHDYDTVHAYQKTTGTSFNGNKEWAAPKANNFSCTFSARVTSAESNGASIGFFTEQPSNAATAPYAATWGAYGNTQAFLSKFGNPVVQNEKKQAKLGKTGEWKQFWALVSSHSLSFGQGAIPGQNVLGIWSDPEPGAKPITHIGFSGNSSALEVKDIVLTAVEDQTTYTITRPQYGTYQTWQPLWKLHKKNEGGVSFTLSNLTPSSEQFAQIGYAAQPAATDSRARYDVIIGKDNKISIKKGATIVASMDLPTSAQMPKTGESKQFWSTYTKGTIHVGVGSYLGLASSPLLSWTDPDAGKEADIDSFSFATGNHQATFSDITSINYKAFAQKVDQMMTSGKIHYQWFDNLQLQKANDGMILFKVKKEEGNLNLLVALAGGTKPEDKAQNYAGALYNILMRSSGHIYVTTVDKPISAKGLAVHDKVKTLNDGKEHMCWLQCSGHTIMVGIDSQPGKEAIWEWTNPDPKSLPVQDKAKEQAKEPSDALASFDAVSTVDGPAIRYFSFATHASRAHIYNIESKASLSIKTLSRQMGSAITLLAHGKPEEAANRIQSIVVEQLHSDSLDEFIQKLALIISYAELLFNDAKGIQEKRKPAQTAAGQIILSTIKDLSFDPTMTGEHKSRLTALTTKLDAPFDPSQAMRHLASQATAAFAQQMKSTSPQRLLFMKALSVWGSMPKEFAVSFAKEFKVSVLDVIRADKLTADESTRIENVKKAIDVIVGSLVSAQALKTFEYHFSESEKIKSNLSLHARKLRDILVLEYSRKITFKDGDALRYLTAVKDLAAQNDDLSEQARKDIRYIIKVATKYSRVYKGKPEADEFTAVEVLLNTVSSLSERIEKYVLRLDTILPLTADDAKRKQFFISLQNLKNGGVFTQADAKKVKEELVEPLMIAQHTDEEETLLKGLESYIDKQLSAMKSATYRLSQTEKTVLDLFEYAKEVDALLQDKETTFVADDYKKLTIAFTYITVNRELLSSEQRSFVETMLDYALSLEVFSAHKTTLLKLKTMIVTPHEFAQRISYAAKELTSLTGKKIPFSSTRFKRFIEKIKIIMQAPGTKTEADFKKLEQAVLTPLSQLELEGDQKRAIQALIKEVKDKQAEVIAAQRTFIYHFDLAQKEKENHTAFITALAKIIRNHNARKVLFSPGDDQKFVDALKELVARRDELSSGNKTALQSLLSSAIKYSPAYKGKKLANELQRLKQNLETKVPFKERLERHTGSIDEVISLESSDPKRIAFFRGLERLARVSPRVVAHS